jgi:hypothetical protein
MCEVLRVVQGQVHDYNDVLGAFEQVWNLRGGILEEPGILQRYGQGCVGRLRGLEDPILPLSALTGVQS